MNDMYLKWINLPLKTRWSWCFFIITKVLMITSVICAFNVVYDNNNYYLYLGITSLVLSWISISISIGLSMYQWNTEILEENYEFKR